MASGFITPWQINQYNQGKAITATGGATFQKGVQPQSGVAQPPAGGTQSTPVTGPIASPMAGGTDAYKQAALQRLNATAQGQNVPVTEQQKAGMLSTQSDMSAAAEAQQNAALRRTTAAGGGSLYDPSHGAAERENASDRQIANQQAKRDIDMGAQAQNFEAQFAADRLLAAQGGGGGDSYGSGSGPSSTPGGDRVQGYGGLDLSQRNLTTTNRNPSTLGLRQPTTGGTAQQPQGQPSTGGSQSFTQYLDQQRIQQFQQEQAKSALLSDPYKRRRYDMMIAQGYDEARALQLLGGR